MKMRRYKVIKELGDGTYGSVSLARNLDKGDLVAIKKYVQYMHISCTGSTVYACCEISE